MTSQQQQHNDKKEEGEWAPPDIDMEWESYADDRATPTAANGNTVVVVKEKAEAKKEEEAAAEDDYAALLRAFIDGTEDEELATPSLPPPPSLTTHRQRDMYTKRKRSSERMARPAKRQKRQKPGKPPVKLSPLDLVRLHQPALVALFQQASLQLNSPKGKGNSKSPQSHVEVEIRLGQDSGSGHGFQSGISREAFEAILNVLQTRIGSRVPMVTESVDLVKDTTALPHARVYRLGFGMTQRGKRRATPTTILYKEVQRKQTLSITLKPYALRMALSLEHPFQGDAKEKQALLRCAKAQAATTSTRYVYEGRRYKDRWTFRFPNRPWHLDLTRVRWERNADTTTATAATPPTIQYEVELELDRNCLKPLCQHDAREKLATLLLRELQQFYVSWFGMRANVSITTQVFPTARLSTLFFDVEGYDICREDERAYIAQVLEDALHLSSSQRRLWFPGTQPATFTLQTTLNSDYHVAEKTDGVRYLLIAAPNGKVYLMNRAARVFQLDRRYVAPFIDVWCTCDGADDDEKKHAQPLRQQAIMATVLDGELVRDVQSQRLVFVFFDALCIQGRCQMTLPFTQRYANLKTLLHAMQQQQQHKTNSSTLPNLYWHYKPFVPITAIRQCFERIVVHQITHERVHRFKGGSGGGGSKEARTSAFVSALACRTDGLIFVPNRPYVMGTDWHLLKWKYPDTMTVDFGLVPHQDGGGGYSMHVQTGRYRDQTTVCRQMPASIVPPRLQLDFQRYRQWIRRFKSNPEKAAGYAMMIAECRYNTRAGRWDYVCARPDKQRPNVLGVLLDTLEAQAQHLTRTRLIEWVEKQFS